MQLVDTERDGHRVAFNNAFEQKGLPHEWDVETYGRLLATGGGKERMTKYFTEHADKEPFKSITDDAERQTLVKEIHLLKTGIFQKMIEDGQMPLRPGVKAFVGAAPPTPRAETCPLRIHMLLCELSARSQVSA